MALRHHKERHKVLIARSLNPAYRAVAEQYLGSLGIRIETIPFLPGGLIDMDAFDRALDSTTAAVLVQYPNFFGVVDNLKDVAAKAKAAGALTVVSADPLVYGLYESAAEIGADIAVGDTQPFGLPLQYGGPYAGYMACRQELVRQMPGRIVGETRDGKGRRGFVLTLQAREQHIRREKATSNVCTNQALAALASLVAILWYGKEGIPKLALTNYQRAAYLKSRLEKLPNAAILSKAPFFNEFAVKFDHPLQNVYSHFRKNGIEPGIDLGTYYPELKGCLLVAVTETKSKQQLDRYVEVAKTMGSQ